MNLLNATCRVGQTNLDDFHSKWKAELPAYLLMICRSGEATFEIHCDARAVRPGSAVLLSYDAFPLVTGVTADFMADFLLIDRDYGDLIMDGPVANHFDVFYWNPVAQVGDSLDQWMEMIGSALAVTRNAYCKEILFNSLQNLFLICLDQWQKQFSGQLPGRKVNQAEKLCTDFYNLLFDQFKEHRDIAYYASRLNVSQNYLAIVTRKLSGESPKQVIDRRVTIEIKNLLQKTRMTVAQIADELHFPDTSYLCRYFRRQTGMAISEFRKL